MKPPGRTSIWSGVRRGHSSIADEIACEVRYHPGWPRVIRGREELIRQFLVFVRSIRLPSADNLIVHRADGGRVVVIEYEVHGTILATGATYENRFCSIIETVAHSTGKIDTSLEGSAHQQARENQSPTGSQAIPNSTPGSTRF